MADISDTPGWRTGVLFLLFAVLTIILEHGTEWLEHRWSKRRGTARSNGLITMFNFIKQELFLLGLISMVLTAVQDQMLRICITDRVASYGLHWYPDQVGSYGKVSSYTKDYMSGKDGSKEYKGGGGDYGSTQGGGGDYGGASNEGGKGGDAYSYGGGGKNATYAGRHLLDTGRHLLGGAPKSEYNTCGKGQQPLFSAYMIYQVHLLIFLLAVVHVLYVFGTIMVCLFQIRQWRRWEEEAPAAEAFLRVSNVPTTPRTPAAPAGAARGAWAHPDAAAKRARRSAKKLWARIGTNRFTHACHVALGVVTHDLVFSPVTRVVYYSLRLMFIDRLGLDYSFDFASFIERSIEEHIPYLMKLNAPMMCLAAALLSFPFPAYMPYWLFGLGVVVELVLAGKLASISTLAAGQALVQYSEDFGGGTSHFGRDGDADPDHYTTDPDPDPDQDQDRGGRGSYDDKGRPGLLEICVESKSASALMSELYGGSGSGAGGAAAAAAAAAPAPFVRVSASAGAAPPAPPVAAPPGDVEMGAAPAARSRSAFAGAAGAAAAAIAAADAGGRASEELLEHRLESRLAPGAPPERSAASAPPLAPHPALKPLRTAAPPSPVHASAAAPARTTAPSLDARSITRRIERCASLQELEDFVADHGAAFNQIHVSLALLQLHRIAERSAASEKAAAAGGGTGGGGRPLGEAAEGEREDYAAWQRLSVHAPARNRGAADGASGATNGAVAGSPGLRRADSQSAWDALQSEADAMQSADQDDDVEAAKQSAQSAARTAYFADPRTAAGKGATRPPPPPAAPRSPSVSSVTLSRRQQKVMARVAVLPRDPSKLFWFGRPSLMIHAFQFVFYSNAFMLTIAFFAFWQKHAADWMYQGVGIIPTVLLIVGSVLLAIHSALRVLPQFALIEPVGRHCPENVLRRALKEGGLQPEEAAALAAQLGVELPAEKKKRKFSSKLRRTLSWGLLDGESRAGRDKSKAKRVLGKILAIDPKDDAIWDGGDAAVVAPRAGGGHGHGAAGGGRADGGRPHRRSLEEIKSASMVQLLGLLNTADGAAGAGINGGAGVHGAPVGASSAAAGAAGAPGPEAWQAAADGDGHAQEPPAAGAAGAAGAAARGLQRSKSLSALGGAAAANLLASSISAAGGHGGHGHGHGHGHGGGHGGHGSSEPSSNMELAGEMIRALVLKQARAGQPVTPRSGAAGAGPHATPRTPGGGLARSMSLSGPLPAGAPPGLARSSDPRSSNE